MDETLSPPRPSAPEILTDKRPHAVVIGSGFGGLAGAVRLGARGYRVTVLEQLGDIGGRGRVFRDKGHLFDAGPTIITVPQVFEALWTLCGKRMSDYVTLTKLDPFYTVRWSNGQWLTCSDDPQKMRDEIMRIEPSDVKGYEQYLKESERNYHVGFELLSTKPFDSIWDMMKVVPEFVRCRADRTVAQHVASLIKNPQIQFGLGFHPLFVGGNPFAVTSIYSLIAYLERAFGVWWATGGTGALARGIADLVIDQGGQIRTNAEVTEIMVNGRTATGVRLATGEEIAADVVVSNADSTLTYKKLLPDSVPLSVLTKRTQRQSMSVFVWYFGTKGTQGQAWPEIGHHTILLGDRYRELLDDIFNKRTLPDDFGLYLHRPTATDPSMAPPGDDTFYVLSPVANLLGEAEWPQAAEAYKMKIAAYLEKHAIPGFMERISTSRVITPAYFEKSLQSVDGAAFGPEPLFTQSAWLRPHNRSKEIDNLFLVGAGTHPGAGLPGVVSSAAILDEIVPDASRLN